MRIIFSLLITIFMLYGSNETSLASGVFKKAIKTQEPFVANITQKDNKIVVDIKIAKDAYLYKSFLYIALEPQNTNITDKITLPKTTKYHSYNVYFDKLSFQIPLSLIKQTSSKATNILVQFQGCSKQGICYAPIQKRYSLTNKQINKQIDKQKPINETTTITQTLKDGNIFLILATFFGFGLLLSLTPCVFPMIPILSSIIVQHSNNQKGTMSASRGFVLSLVYVLSMSVAYTLAGVLAGLFGANIQAMLQNQYVIIGFVAIFVILAFSMFGYYEIALPSSWQTKISKTSDAKSKNGGFLSIAIMGFLSALIVGPCVAPPLAGALVYIGQTGDALLGGLALFVLSLGMGVPLLLIGIGAGKYMPKPGGWMNSVSKFFGVIMLGVAIWMLSRIVPFAVTIWLTVALFMGTAFYLIRQKTKLSSLGAVALMIGSMVFMTQALKYNSNTNLHYKYIKTYAQLDQLVKNSNKPIMVDFWASWCVSCAELEKITFSNPKVQEKLKQYILVKVDVTNNTPEDKELMKRFNIFGPPVILFFENGSEQQYRRVVGFKDPKEFLKILSQSN